MAAHILKEGGKVAAGICASFLLTGFFIFKITCKYMNILVNSD